MAARQTAAHSADDRAAVRPDDPMPVPSFRDVYDQHFDFVWTCVRGFGVPVEAADDVVQETFIVVHARLETLEHPGSIRSWLYGIVRRTVSTHFRARKARVAREIAGDDTVDNCANPLQRSPLDLAVLGDEVELLWRLLEELAPPKREVLMLAELKEMTMPEIAEILGIPLNTAYSRLRSARIEFDAIFARDAARQRTRT